MILFTLVICLMSGSICVIRPAVVEDYFRLRANILIRIVGLGLITLSLVGAGVWVMILLTLANAK